MAPTPIPRRSPGFVVFVQTVLIVVTAGWLDVAARPPGGPASAYYVTSGNQGTNWILRRSSATAFAQVHWFVQNGFVYGEHAIAVGKTVRTLGTNANGLASLGAEYTRRGSYTGTDFAFPAGVPSSLGFLDATTDGEHIYAVDAYGASVWQMDLDWNHPVQLFAVNGNDLGITFDPAHNGSLWVSSVSEHQTIRNYTLSGELIFSFAIPTGASALARDPHDGTLWFTHGFDGTFYQYASDGRFLGSVTYDALAGTNHLGGEFRASPGKH